MSAETPLGLAILFCDKIIVEAETNKKTLVGIFNQISSKKFPCKHPEMSVFLSVTNIYGKQPVNLRIIHFEKEFELMSAKGEIQAVSPNDVVELVFNLRGIQFKEPGMYCFEFYIDGELILPRRFQVNKID